MIDLHSHILPGIDDGARTMAMSIDMAKQTLECGVTHLVCTPHIHPGFFDNTPAIIENAYNELVLALEQENIPLTLSYAAELRVSEHIPIWIKQNAVPLMTSSRSL